MGYKGITLAHANAEVTFEIESLENAETHDLTFTFKPIELCMMKGWNVSSSGRPVGLSHERVSEN